MLHPILDNWDLRGKAQPPVPQPPEASGGLGCCSQLVRWKVVLWSLLGAPWPPKATLPGASSNLSAFHVAGQRRAWSTSPRPHGHVCRCGGGETAQGPGHLPPTPVPTSQFWVREGRSRFYLPSQGGEPPRETEVQSRCWPRPRTPRPAGRRPPSPSLEQAQVWMRARTSRALGREA